MLPIGRVKDAISVTAQRSAGQAPIKTTAVPGEDIVVVHIAGGPDLWLHPETARDLLQAQKDPLKARGAEEPLAAGEVEVPVRLQWRLEEASPARGATRGFLGDVLVRAITVVTGVAEDKAADFAASAVVKKFDQQVDPGIYLLEARELASLKGRPTSAITASDQTTLVLIHGTFSNTAGTFGKLWLEHPQLVRSLFKAYGDRVYALDHPTLGVSPVANAITLAEAAPTGAKLHLLTHSRGGLVAEVLARVCANPLKASAGYGGDSKSRKELERLCAIVAKKRIAVDRVVRVACPARGTLLASKRLDAYVSVLKWALDLAQVPAAPELIGFLGEVARRRADPEMLPGLAAQIPDSPLIQWLHADGLPIQGDLRVVAGDIEGDSVVSWLKTLLSDAFYWTDHDLVVQTRSMYGGTPRGDTSTFLLDRGGKVSHFAYFSNPSTASAIVNALTERSPEGFGVIGPLSWSGTSATGTRAAVVTRASDEAANLPAVFLLPGILGSHLRAGKERIWLGWRIVNNFSRLAYASKATVSPDGPIEAFYDDLAMFLSQTHDVRPFAFDWRRPITEEAKRLAGEIDEALDARKKSGKPVRILAHSMGGLVARTLQLVSEATWNRLIASEGSRILMLGTPNGGSFAPMQVLSGDDTFGNLLTTVGAPFRANETRELIAAFPGLIQLQAGLLDELGSAKAWRTLADADLAAITAQTVWHRLSLQRDQYKWGVPTQEVLDAAVKLRRDLDRQRDHSLPAFAHKLLLVVGSAPLTPAGFQRTNAGVVYLNASQGDGRVTHESAVLPGVATWAIDAGHGDLPRRKDAFPGYLELLEKGTTKQFAQAVAAGASRGAAKSSAALVPNRPSRTSTGDVPPQRQTDVLARAGADAGFRTTPAAAALRLSVVNGDLTYTEQPLLIGHYRASRLTGAEAVIDRAVDRAMSASLSRGLYPLAPGSHQVFVNTNRNPENAWQLPRPEAVIVAGLGAEGELRGTDLTMTVRQAVVAWAQRLTETTPVPAVFTLATTLLGSGGSGITAGQAAQLIAQGVLEANEQLSQEGGASGDRWPRVERLIMIELYLDRASEAWIALQELAAAQPAGFSVDPVIEPGTGALRRPPDAGYRGADYDFISAVTAKTDEGGEQIVYTVNTKRARSDVRPQPTQVTLIRNLVSNAASSASSDGRIGRTLFSLLVPTDLEPFMGSSTETVIELDEGTSGIPWEVLEPARATGRDDTPWSIRTKLLRKLKLSTPSQTTVDAGADDSILVIGDPACDRTKYPMLTGARLEAQEVVACLMPAIASPEGESVATARVKSVISGASGDDSEPDARAVINEVMAQPWRIIHIAAHGEPPIDEAGKSHDPRGVVLSGNCFLGPREISALRVIPELVFVNCCHLAASSATVLGPTNYDRARFAAGVAHALIKGGVRCVIAAGWAVDDVAASEFSTTFYKKLLEGARFIDAVAAARAKARGCGGNTWAAYQCYGDPDWKFRRQTGDGQRPTPPPPAREFASIASAPSLISALDRIAVESEFQPDRRAEQPDRLRFLEATHAPFWGHQGDVAEAFGKAWLRAGDFDEAVAWYERARTAQDGTASLAAVEQLVNARVRAAASRVPSTGASPETLDQARDEINDALSLLGSLGRLGTTFERENLLGSTHKRLALLERRAKRPAEMARQIGLMKRHYAAAERMARAASSSKGKHPLSLFYPAMQRIAAQLATGERGAGDETVDDETIEAIRESMKSSTPDFWSVVGQTELDMYSAASRGSLASQLKELEKDFNRHHVQVASSRMWSSVLDNARFALEGYRARASSPEKAAVDRMLTHLEKLAGRSEAAPVASKRVRKVAPRRAAGSKKKKK